ncbi:hypothetical protein I7I50_07858 [Histoplasma capsulatum G186AR]|uniref:Uncharacterized protein n=1 Tax=Ajellomyces capsulatus TaxID=5037 RepID=A0A8H7YJI9_AJECA|nr:hypothetical protein I7I52_08374 [Histoplasma capsulatum]QSS68446.1 hypothetical protein I7I50_07858 [Histoplasma capsulatum G186AR]
MGRTIDFYFHFIIRVFPVPFDLSMFRSLKPKEEMKKQHKTSFKMGMKKGERAGYLSPPLRFVELQRPYQIIMGKLQTLSSSQ